MRFWHTAEVLPSFDADGFLADPETEYGEFINPNIHPLEFFSHKKILILLGEPGSGKSTALREHYGQLVDCPNSPRAIFVDLNTIGSASELHATFNAGAIADWSRGDSEALLYIDSLDESLLNVRTTVPVLLSEFAKLPLRRLQLRIACRTAELPPGVPQSLGHLWEEDANILHLAPLRRRDVISAAKEFGVTDVESFMKEVVSKAVVPFALNPITLRFLAETYKSVGQFPLLRRDLFLSGLKALCRDPQDDIRTPQLVSGARADENLAICARLAAVCVFSNRVAISSESYTTAVAPTEIAGGSEHIGNREVEVTINAINSALRTAVFGSGGRWSHRTYAEFLAAWYVSTHQVPPSTTLALIVHPSDPGRNITPQLHETAAWLASLSREVFEYVLTRQPEIILDSDTHALDEGQRSSSVSALLKRAQDDDPLFYLDWGMWRRYSRLEHASLSDQLSPWIADRNRSSMARWVAIQIAHACALYGLNAELATIALDDGQPYRVRLIAAITLMDSPDSQNKARLRLLAIRDNLHDPDDELKAVALGAVWPDSLSPEELFSSLTPAHTDVMGLYDSFVRSKIVQGLHGNGLGRGLQWVSRQPARGALWRPFGDLINAIMWRAWNELDSTPQLVDDFVDAVMSRTRNYEQITSDDPGRRFDESVRNSPNRRRQVVSRMLEKIGMSNTRSTFSVLYPARLLQREDFVWCLDRAMQGRAEAEIRTYAELAVRLVSDESREQMDLLYAVSRSNETIQQAARPVTYVEFSSDQALGMRESYRAQHPDPTTPLSPDRLLAAIDETVNRNPYNFQNVIVELNRTDPDSDRIWIGSEAIADSPGWKRNGEEVRSGVVRAAKKYITDADPRTADWIGTGQTTTVARWGHMAFELLLIQDESWLRNLDSTHWQRWAGTNVHSHHMHDMEDRILKLNYSKASAAVVAAFCTELKGEVQRGAVTINRITGLVWDKEIKSCLLDHLRQDQSSAHIVIALLRDLFKRERNCAFDVSVELFSRDYKRAARRKHAVAVAAAMFSGACRESWNILWPIFKSDNSFGREVVEESVHGLDSSAALQELTEQQLAELFVWLNSNCATATTDGLVMTPADSVYFFYNSILEHLKSRQTFDAVDALKWIHAQSPDLTWIRIHVRQAEELARGGTWAPPSPSELLSALLHHERRLVESGSDLREVVIESLKRLAAELKAETPAIDDLWDEVSRRQYRPKDETHLSNYIKRYLSRDLPKVIVGREVEIQSSYGVESEYTDLHVDAVVQAAEGRANRVSVIIETKGCWHEDLWSAMRDQLANRYLSHGTCIDGIYLVGWYNCECWDPTDSRKRKAPCISIADALSRLEQQARDLSRDAKRIEPFVLDCGLSATPRNPPPKSSKSQKGGKTSVKATKRPAAAKQRAKKHRKKTR